MFLAVSIVMDNATEETAATEPQSGVRIAGEADLKLAEEIFASLRKRFLQKSPTAALVLNWKRLSRRR